MDYYRGPASDHFDGERFFNIGHPPLRGAPDLARWLTSRKPGLWQKWRDFPPGSSPAEQVADGRLVATFIGHSTVLIQMDGINVLCDPIWSRCASPFSWIGPPRHSPPGLRIDDLPRIDVVLLSHDHYDHFDRPTLLRLAKKWHPRFVAPLGVAARLAACRIARNREVLELDWWHEDSLPGELRVTCARHFSGRGVRDRNRTLWCGYMLEGSSGAVFFAGDTAYGPHFAQIRRKFSFIRLAFLPIGSFRPEWFMGSVHMSPVQAVQAARDLRAATNIGIHFGTFRLADDGQDEPVIELEKALNAANESAGPAFWTLRPGEGREIT